MSLGMAPLSALAAHDAAPSHEAQAATDEVTAEQALQALTEGNRHFVEAHPVHPHQGKSDILRVAGGQHPFAVVISCSDSREVPELIFDQGVGDLFVIRVAGNVLDDAALGSVEYAAEHLQTPLVVVMGHKRCGAVTAAVDHIHEHNHIDRLVDAIRPALHRAAPGTAHEVIVDSAVHDNIAYGVKQLLHDKPTLSRLAASGKVKVVGAYYDLDTGAVTWLDTP